MALAAILLAGSCIGESSRDEDSGSQPGWSEVGGAGRWGDTLIPDSTGVRLAIVTDTMPACPSCRIELRPITTIGDLADSLIPKSLPKIVRDSRGITYAADLGYAAYTDVLIYDPAGRYIGILGRQGEGPGEFPFPIDIALGLGDSVFILHPPRRISVFGPDHEFARSFDHPLTRIEDVRVLPSGAMLFGGSLPGTRSAQAPPLHLVSAEGRIVRSFGSPSFVTRGGPADPVMTLGGRPSRLIRPPAQDLVSLHQDTDGLLWVALQVPVSDWREVDVAYHPRSSEGRLDDSMYDRLIQTVIDVYDPASGRLVVRQRFPGYGFIANDGSFYHPFVTDDGLVRVEISAMRLVTSGAMR